MLTALIVVPVIVFVSLVGYAQYECNHSWETMNRQEVQELARLEASKRKESEAYRLRYSRKEWAR